MGRWLSDVLFVVMAEVVGYPKIKIIMKNTFLIPLTALRSTSLRSGNTSAWLFGPMAQLIRGASVQQP